MVPDAWPRSDDVVTIRQGYLADQDGLVCRVRQKNEEYYLSLKARIDSMSSYDYEYLIPGEDGRTMLDNICLLYTSPSPRDGLLSRMPSSA